MSADAQYPFPGLTAAQRRVFEAIAVNDDGGHHPKTLRVLLKRRLIVAAEEEDHRSWPPMLITRYHVPLPIHIEWCAWCDRQGEVLEGREEKP